MTDELVAFLRARYDDEEQLARRVADRYAMRGPYAEDPGTPFWPSPRVRGAFKDYDDPGMAAGLDLIESYSPARVLAEIDAKRRIVEWVAGRVEDREDFPDDADYLLDAAQAAWFAKVLALPYAGHEGYRAEWRPA